MLTVFVLSSPFQKTCNQLNFSLYLAGNQTLVNICVCFAVPKYLIHPLEPYQDFPATTRYRWYFCPAGCRYRQLKGA